jgi:hypothetical protein
MIAKRLIPFAYSFALLAMWCACAFVMATTKNDRLVAHIAIWLAVTSLCSIGLIPVWLSKSVIAPVVLAIALFNEAVNIAVTLFGHWRSTLATLTYVIAFLSLFALPFVLLLGLANVVRDKKR